MRRASSVAIEHEIDPDQGPAEVGIRHAADAVGEQFAIDRDDLRDVGHLESCGRPVVAAGSVTFPGAPPKRRLLVRGITTAVEMRLVLKPSPWTITTGRRNPAPGSPRALRDTAHCGFSPTGSRVHRHAGTGHPGSKRPSSYQSMTVV